MHREVQIGQNFRVGGCFCVIPDPVPSFDYTIELFRRHSRIALHSIVKFMLFTLAVTLRQKAKRNRTFLNQLPSGIGRNKMMPPAFKLKGDFAESMLVLPHSVKKE